MDGQELLLEPGSGRWVGGRGFGCWAPAPLAQVRVVAAARAHWRRDLGGRRTPASARPSARRPGRRRRGMPGHGRGDRRRARVRAPRRGARGSCAEAGSSTVQLVRTVAENMYAAVPHGDFRVLESYMRANASVTPTGRRSTTPSPSATQGRDSRRWSTSSTRAAAGLAGEPESAWTARARAVPTYPSGDLVRRSGVLLRQLAELDGHPERPCDRDCGRCYRGSADHRSDCHQNALHLLRADAQIGRRLKVHEVGRGRRARGGQRGDASEHERPLGRVPSPRACPRSSAPVCREQGCLRSWISPSGADPRRRTAVVSFSGELALP
jgi:hypothetical protein